MPDTAQGVLESVRENERGRKIHQVVRSRRELDGDQRDIGIVSEMQQPVEKVRYERGENEFIERRARATSGSNDYRGEIRGWSIRAANQRTAELDHIGFPLRPGAEPVGAVDEIG